METEKMFNTDLNTPKSEIEARIKNLQRKLVENKIDGVLILQKADLFYFSVKQILSSSQMPTYLFSFSAKQILSSSQMSTYLFYASAFSDIMGITNTHYIVL